MPPRAPRTEPVAALRVGLGLRPAAALALLRLRRPWAWRPAADGRHRSGEAL